MVAEPLPLLSDAVPVLARRAGLDNRFSYWQGQSGQRYLFSAVPFDALADFRSSVAILAEPTNDGRFIAWSAATIDKAGYLHLLDDAWPVGAAAGTLAFVHFLAETDADRQSLVDDLFPAAQVVPEFSLAA